MWIFARPLQELQASDLDALITNRVREGPVLEFKRDMYGGKDSEIREMLRDVSSIANGEGGALIIGMEADPDGIATALRPVPDAETQSARLISSCAANIAERIPGLQAIPVPISGGHAVVVRVPRSYRRPHMITFEGRTDFWTRHDRQKARMSIAEIRTVITTTEDLALRVEQLIEKRRDMWKIEGRQLFALMATPLLLDRYITRAELQRLSDEYKRIAGFAREDVA